MTTFLLCAAWVFIAASFAASIGGQRYGDRRRNLRLHLGFMALAGGTCAASAYLAHQWFLGDFYSLIGAAYTWAWWKSGVGDNTRRRLRKLRTAFVPVRRTAPATSSA